MEAREASRDAKSLAAWISPPPRLEVTAAATSSHVGLAQRQRKVTAPSHGNPLHATPRGQGFVSPQVAYALELRKSCASCTRAPGITSRAARRAQPHVLLAPSSQPPVPMVPAGGRRCHAVGSPAHTRAGECRASVGSRGRRAHQASSTCAGRSRRATARRSSPATPPAPDGEPPGRRTPSAAHPPAFPPDLDLRRHPRVSCRHPASHPPGGVRGLSGNDSSSTAVR